MIAWFKRLIQRENSYESFDDGPSPMGKWKSKIELIRLSAVVCGIEFCYAAETAFVSPILLEIGLPVMFMTWTWCLPPFIGFFLVPALGSLSDGCQTRFGRRRPFILLYSIGILIGLFLVANGECFNSCDFVNSSRKHQHSFFLLFQTRSYYGSVDGRFDSCLVEQSNDDVNQRETNRFCFNEKIRNDLNHNRCSFVRSRL